uniref:glycine receptor subunit alpha-2-like isoform X2 n=1 Tax=Styela clava TaxID=7725 RepID=UPI00193976DB|nr:glycine receptor subunit alpha-2-like isoform X2 [Styela clava]
MVFVYYILVAFQLFVFVSIEGFPTGNDESTPAGNSGYEYEYNYFYTPPDNKGVEGQNTGSSMNGETLMAAEHKARDTNEIEFLEGLLINYDQRIRPNNNDGPVKTLVQIYVNSFYSVIQASMDYKLNIFLRLRWNDPRLAHNFNDKAVALHPSMLGKIWKPDVFFSNEKHAAFHSVTTENKLLRVYTNGDVYSSVRLTLTLSCAMHLRNFPMDVQICNMEMESFGYDMKDLIFDWDGPHAVQLPKTLALPQFRIRGYRLNTCTKVYSTGSFTCLGADFILQRQMGYYIIQMYAPSLMIVILSWVAFWINMDAAPARTALGITTVLTMTTQSSGARASLPKVSYVKAIDVWFAVCLIFVFAALIEFAVVNFLSRQEKSFFKLGLQLANIKKEEELDEQGTLKPKKRRRDVHSDTTGDGISTEMKAMSTTSPTPTSASRYSMIGQIPDEEKSKKERYRWKAKRIDRISRVCFPLSFIVFNLFYWIVYQVARDDLRNVLDGAIPYDT